MVCAFYSTKLLPLYINNMIEWEHTRASQRDEPTYRAGEHLIDKIDYFSLQKEASQQSQIYFQTFFSILVLKKI